MTVCEMTDADKIMNPEHPDRNPDKSGYLASNPGSLLVEVRRLGGGNFAFAEHSLVVYLRLAIDRQKRARALKERLFACLVLLW